MELWKHQKRTIARAEKLDNLALLQDPGVGKTLSMIRIIENLFDKYQRPLRTIIFSPVSVLGNWKAEFERYSSVDRASLYMVVGSRINRSKIIAEAQKSDGIIILNYEATQNKDILERLKIWEPEVLVADESQRCKSPTTVRSKNVTDLADIALHRYILTGTPVLNSMMDLFQQFRILDGGETFGKNFWVFRGKYFEDANVNWQGPQRFAKWVPRKGTLDEFNKKIDAVSVKVRKQDCLDLPPLIQKTIHVQLTRDQEKIYNQMRDEFIAFLEQDHKEPKAVVSQFAMHKVLRLQQIVCGFVNADDGETVRFKKNPRLEVLSDLLNDICLYEKVIVWTHFQANQDDVVGVCKKLKLKHAELFGRTKDKQNQINLFQENADVRVMVANQSAGGVGVNLQQASTAIYYSKGFGLEADLQSIARCYRGGSEIHSKITRIDLIAPGTIDQIITDALFSKKDISDRVMQLAKHL